MSVDYPPDPRPPGWSSVDEIKWWAEWQSGMNGTANRVERLENLIRVALPLLLARPMGEQAAAEIAQLLNRVDDVVGGGGGGVLEPGRGPGR